jgi:hypothetical protein
VTPPEPARAVTSARMPRNEALHRLDVLVGEWRFEAVQDGVSVSSGHASIGWLEGDGFLVVRADADPPTAETPQVWIDNSPYPTVAVVAYDDPTGRFVYAYADGRGVSRLYESSFDGREWKVWGQAGPGFFQRITYEVGADTIRGRIEQSPDGETGWETDFDIVYARV